MSTSFRKLTANKLPYLLLLTYFLFRIANLTKLPIFNDEAIYLNWGWVETHKPGFLYYSLYDAKQPFLMWIFGIFQTLLPDPLFAGRLVSVITGLLAMIGIYKISKEYFSKKTAIIASLIYIFAPIFVFYDRQALMESTIGAVGIWSLYFLLKTIKKKNNRYAIFLGIILGIGFFIKSSALIFIGSTFLIYAHYFLRTNDKKTLIKNASITLAAILLIDGLLFLNPEFWSTLGSNSRWGFSISELLKFPIKIWVNNLLGNIEIGFFYLTPIVFIFGLSGIFWLIKNRKEDLTILSWFLISLFLQILISKGTSTRYIVSFLPLCAVFAAYFIESINQKFLIYKYFLYFVALLPPVAIAIILIINPVLYIEGFSKVSRFSDEEYIKGQTSGVNINKVVSYLKERIGARDTYVATALNTGNPESAINIYFEKSKNIKVIFLDSQLFRNPLDKYKCLKLDEPVYFVSRDQQQGGLNKFFVKLTSFNNPYSNYSIGIYKIGENCQRPATTIHISREN